MISITDRCRKILRTVFSGIGVSVVSLIIQACYIVIPLDNHEFSAAYGMPPPDPPDYVQKTSIYGKVVAKETGKPIFGIQVSIEETDYWNYTDKYGGFSLCLPVQDTYKIKFEDVDGPYNDGLFKEQIWTLKDNDTHTNLLIGMDLDTKTDTNTETDTDTNTNTETDAE